MAGKRILPFHLTQFVQPTYKAFALSHLRYSRIVIDSWVKFLSLSYLNLFVLTKMPNC